MRGIVGQARVANAKSGDNCAGHYTDIVLVQCEYKSTNSNYVIAGPDDGNLIEEAEIITFERAGDS